MAQKSDIEIAQNVTPEDITVIAERAHIAPEYIEQYGKTKAKVDTALLKDSERYRDKPDPCGRGQDDDNHRSG